METLCRLSYWGLNACAPDEATRPGDSDKNGPCELSSGSRTGPISDSGDGAVQVWQVQDSNLRRLCRLIYSQLPLAARATCRVQVLNEDR